MFCAREIIAPPRPIIAIAVKLASIFFMAHPESNALAYIAGLGPK
jgi:hypothetical protein